MGERQKETDNKLTIFFKPIPKQAAMNRNKYFFSVHTERYRNLTIDQKINLRQHINGLKINWLFRATIEHYMRNRCHEHNTEYPPVNNGLYHHIGKNHSQYPIVIGGRANYNQREEQSRGIYR